MFFYYGIILYVVVISMLFNDFSPKDKKIIVYLTMPVLWAVSAFRNINIGNDTVEYIRVFELVKNNNNILLFADRYELGYLILNKATSIFFNNPESILVVTSTIIYFGYSRFILKFSKDPGFSVLLFIIMGYFTQSLNLIRFQLACVFLLLAYEMLMSNKIKSYLSFVIIAFLFHKTAIVFLIAYPLSKLKLNKKNLIRTTIGTMIAYVYLVPIMNYLSELLNYYNNYSDSSYSESGIKIASVLFLFLTAVLLLLVYFIRKNNINFLKYNTNEDSMTFLLFIGACLLFISFKFTLLDRVSDYFRIYSIVLIPNMMIYINDKYKRLFISLLIILLFLASFLFINIYRPNWNHIYPYETWLFKNK